MECMLIVKRYRDLKGTVCSRGHGLLTLIETLSENGHVQCIKATFCVSPIKQDVSTLK